MNSNNKHTILIWAIVILAVLNISTLATILYHHYKQSIEQRGCGNGNKILEANAEKFSGRYFRDQLNFNSNQMGTFREFNRPFRQQARAITVELAQKRKTMLTEMAKPATDTIKLNVLADSIGILHSNLKKLTFNYYLKVKAICNPLQQAKLEQLFNEMFTNDAPMSFPGHGRRGMGMGKGIRN